MPNVKKKVLFLENIVALLVGNDSLFGAVAVEAALPDVVVEPLVLGVPEVGSVMEAHLRQHLGEAVVSVLDVLVGRHIHVKGSLDLLYPLCAKHLQSLLQLCQSVDAGDCEDGVAGERVDHIGLHGAFREDDPCRR